MRIRVKSCSLFLALISCICFETVASGSSSEIPEETLLKTEKEKIPHFTWGFDIGASIDLGGHDMSTFDVEGMLGYKNSFLQAAGVGVGIRKAFGNEYTFVPVYALVRTSFRSRPSLFFFDGRVGYSFNTLDNTGSHGGLIFSAGVGINLSVYDGIKSHIIIGYSYYGLKEAYDASVPYKGDNIDYATLRIGVSF